MIFSPDRLPDDALLFVVLSANSELRYDSGSISVMDWARRLHFERVDSQPD